MNACPPLPAKSFVRTNAPVVRLLSLRIGKNIEYILATFRGAVNLKDIATFWRGGAQYVDQYFGASGRPARGQKKFGI